MHLFWLVVLFSHCSTGVSVTKLSDSISIDEFNLLENQHPCNRPCKKNSSPMVCHYSFTLEIYSTMSRACFKCPKNVTDCYRKDCVPGDGISKPIFTINRQMPGPSIQVCQGDEVVVNVENHLPNEETSIHWHGQHQMKTPYMDGVPHVTQCAISSGNSFTYQFIATQIGTHFWHSHSGLQRGDGCYGPLIVKGPKETNPHFNLYDFDLSSHIITVGDWIHDTSISRFVGHYHSTMGNKADTLLVNGLGYFDLTNHTNGIPPPVFNVQSGYRYRFRLINAGFLNCPIEVSIDNHTFIVINSDGNDFEAVEVNSMVTYAGDRFDFIVKADQDVKNYWIRFRGLVDCGEMYRSAHQIAVLHYEDADEDALPEGVPQYKTAHQEGLQLNALNEGTTNYSSISIPKLNAIAVDDISLKEKPDYQFYISYDFNNITSPRFHAKELYDMNTVSKEDMRFTPQLNLISMEYQPFPLLPGRELITSNMFCNESTVSNCDKEYCGCTHVLQVKFGSVVELVIVDIGKRYDANHPFHLHGNVFRVVAMERLGNSTTVEEVKAFDAAGYVQRKLERAPLKDTITIPDGGFTIVRFHANNPGYWLFHCHIDFHSELGMALVFKVGEDSDMPPVPPGFPTCGNWKHHHHYYPVTDICNNTVEMAGVPFYKKVWYDVFQENECATDSSALAKRPMFAAILAALFLARHARTRDC